jgi:hypothetical protein
MKWSSISAAAAALLPLASGAGFSTEEYVSNSNPYETRPAEHNTDHKNESRQMER